MHIRSRLGILAIALLSALACDDSRRATGEMELTISGAFAKTVRGPLEGGYSATDAGGGYSLGLLWPEDSADRQDLPMSRRNASPTFAWYAQQQPPVGVHQVTTLERGFGHAGAIYALLGAPHDDISWSSDSGTIRIVESNDRSLHVEGTFDIWFSCTQDCPCKDKPCQVRVRGSMRTR